MKRLWDILLVTLAAAALMQLYYIHMDLKYNSEALAWQVKGQTDQFKALTAASFARTRRDAQKIAELEAKIKALTAERGPTN